jgi:hypothetical protein
MAAQMKTITTVTEKGLELLETAQKGSTTAFTQFVEEAKFKNLVDGLVVGLEKLTLATKEVATAVGGTKDKPSFTADGQTSVFVCMRTLNRVEDITIDSRPGLQENNKELERIHEDSLVDACCESLKGAPALVTRVKAVHEPFPDPPEQEEPQARLARFWEIQDLRSAIIAHFAT